VAFGKEEMKNIFEPLIEEIFELTRITIGITSINLHLE
jgi:hypothetical protein